MGSLPTTHYDFITVGAGPAGSTIANTLVRSKERPEVLLLEAGGRNDTKEWRIDAERYSARCNPAQAWEYKTVPQMHLDGNVIECDRGKGLGGSTATNYSVWNIGQADDHDEIASLVNDEEWRWEAAQKRYQRLESHHGSSPEVPERYRKYLDPNPEVHGLEGPVKVGFASEWEKTVNATLDLFVDEGYALNKDLNSGYPFGISIAPNSAYRGYRSTAADKLADAPDKQRFRATKQNVLSAGALDTPRILMHSGVGPVDQLKKFDIPFVHEISHIGQNLRDHHHVGFTYERDDHTTERQQYYRSKELQAAAPGFFKSDAVLKSAEFESLPEADKAHLLSTTVPTFEIMLNAGAPEYFHQPETTRAVAMVAVFLLNAQSRGTGKVQSAAPSVPLLFDPNFFSHPYDQRVAIEATREIIRVTHGKRFAKRTLSVVSEPKSESDEDILEFWRQTTGSTWHMTGTFKMGIKGEDGACVDKDFKLFGLQNLRVADMSVVPLMPSNHTQTTAYLVSLMAWDRLVAEYGLAE